MHTLVSGKTGKRSPRTFQPWSAILVMAVIATVGWILSDTNALSDATSAPSASAASSLPILAVYTVP